ncbi:MAG: hypothetical protein WC966_08980 [Bradymonadales bacterium]|jgi:hypothetical protein
MIHKFIPYIAFAILAPTLACSHFDYSKSLPPDAMASYIRAVIARENADYLAECAYLQQSIASAGSTPRLEKELAKAQQNLKNSREP